MKGKKYMNRKFVIVGRSGSGKDTIANYMTELFGMKQLLSATTRPRRFEGEASHVFVTDEEAKKMYPRVAETIINGYEYFATRTQFDECDIYLIDPKGLVTLCERAPDVELCLVYVIAPTEIRRARAIARADDKDEAAEIFDKRHADENKMFCELEHAIIIEDDDYFDKYYPNVTRIHAVANTVSTLEEVKALAEAIVKKCTKRQYCMN